MEALLAGKTPSSCRRWCRPPSQRKGGRFHVGMVAAFKSECRPACDRNTGRFRVGNRGRFQSESATDAASAERAVAMATAAHGPARILVNCAGIAPAGRIVGRDGPQPLDEFARVVSVNLIGTFNLMRLAAAAMTTLEPLEDGERGVIVNTASVAAYEGQIGQAAYAASKGGVASLTLPAARELARHGVRVAAIAPGLFGTPMVTAMPQEVQDAIVANIPFPHRFGKPEEYARMVLSIVGNPMVNGSVIRLDAALRMQPK